MVRHKKHVSGGFFPRSKRFGRREEEATPGPGHYLRGAEKCSVSKSFSREKREYSTGKNWTPGPAAYLPKMYTKKSPISLGKVFLALTDRRKEVFSVCA